MTTQNLPELKATIKITDCGFDFWHDRVWILNDIVENKYFYLGRVEHEIISRWHLQSAEKIIDSVNNDTVLNITEQNLEYIYKFLINNNLLTLGSKTIAKIKQARAKPLMSFIKNVGRVFFLKIPLLNPDSFLDKTVEYAKWVFSRQALYIMLFLFIINIFMLASNWGSFTGSMPAFTDFSSMILILFTLVFSKVIHEFGHAYTCKMYGGAVPEMGVTFIFFYPLFYTDATSSMMFESKKRLVVSTAGIRLEMYLAIIAGFFWFFVNDDTIVKNLLFFIATISWLVSVMFNAVPFIKFDGYFILSDYLKIRNLSLRAVAILKFYIRTYLFGIEAICPETYNKKKFRFFVAFSIMTGIYRVFLFIAIFLFLYYIQIVGVLFFVLALGVMVLLPLTRESINIWNLRHKIIKPQNLQVTSAIVTVILLLLLMPVRNDVYMPAVMFAKTQRIYAPFESQIKDIKVSSGAQVQAGNDLMLLFSPKLNKDKIINLLNIETESYYSFGVQLSKEYRKEILAKKSDIDYQKIIEKNIKLKNKQLEIVAPFSGKITAIKDGIYKNTWVKDKAWLMDIVDFNKFYLHAFIKANEMQEVEFNFNTNMVFIPNRSEFPACIVGLKSISTQPINKISRTPTIPLSLAKSTLLNSNLLLFASNYGGNINLQKDDQGNWVPVNSFFTLELEPIEISNQLQCNYGNHQIIKGILKVKGINKSLGYTAYQKVSGALTELR